MMSRLRLLLVRHGESQANQSPFTISGQSNHVLLTELGRKQAKALGYFWAKSGISFDRVWSSTAVRAKETARICLEEFKLNGGKAPDVVEEDENLLEIHMGDWVGREKKDIYTPAMIETIQRDPWRFAPPNGESQFQVEDRMVNFVSNKVIPLLSECEKETLSVALFGHGLAIKCFLRHVLGSQPSETWKIGINNTSITELFWTK